MQFFMNIDVCSKNLKMKVKKTILNFTIANPSCRPIGQFYWNTFLCQRIPLCLRVILEMYYFWLCVSSIKLHDILPRHHGVKQILQRSALGSDVLFLLLLRRGRYILALHLPRDQIRKKARHPRIM